MNDEFRNIFLADFYENYEIDRDGNIRSLKSNDQKFLKHSIDKQGYHYVDLRNKSKRRHAMVHRLVADAFIDNPDPLHKTQVNHKDGDKDNNSVENLEWVTPRENVLHAYEHNLAKVGTDRHNAALDAQSVIDIRNGIISGTETCVSLASKYNVDASVISEVARGKSYKNVPGPVAETKVHIPMFTDEQIARLIEECACASQRVVAKKYGVSQQNISKYICKYKKEHGLL